MGCLFLIRLRSTNLRVTGADSGKRAAADFPGVDLEVVKAMLGAELCSKASNGSKQFTVRAADIAGVTARFLVAQMTLAAMRLRECGLICASHCCVMTRRRLELVHRETLALLCLNAPSVIA